jgi:RNA polymerase sigma-70 factor (ECF subfamily)
MRLEAQERLHHLLERLPDVQREAVMLRFLEALPVQEIARRLGKTHQAVGGLLRRGMGKLREFATLSQEPGGEP